MTDISGNLIQFDFGNQQGGNATLQTPLNMGWITSAASKVGDVMNIKGGDLCYVYDSTY